MINTDYGKKILNAFFNVTYQEELAKVQAYPTNTDYAKALAENKVDFPNIPYLALLTAIPNADGTGYAEPTTEDYNRVSLVNKGPKAVQIMSASTVAAGEAGTEYEGKNIAVIKNQDIIVFPEIEEADYEETIVGFGVFDNGTKESGSPILWGELTEPTPIGEQEIPVFRIGEFVFKLA